MPACPCTAAVSWGRAAPLGAVPRPRILRVDAPRGACAPAARRPPALPPRGMRLVPGPPASAEPPAPRPLGPVSARGPPAGPAASALFACFPLAGPRALVRPAGLPAPGPRSFWRPFALLAPSLPPRSFTPPSSGGVCKQQVSFFPSQVNICSLLATPRSHPNATRRQRQRRVSFLAQGASAPRAPGGRRVARAAGQRQDVRRVWTPRRSAERSPRRRGRRRGHLFYSTTSGGAGRGVGRRPNPIGRSKRTVLGHAYPLESAYWRTRNGGNGVFWHTGTEQAPIIRIVSLSNP